MDTRRITQEEINWVKEGIEMHLDWMVTQLQFYANGEHPEGQIRDPRNTARYEAHAIEYLLNDVKACLQYGKPIPMIVVDQER